MLSLDPLRALPTGPSGEFGELKGPSAPLGNQQLSSSELLAIRLQGLPPPRLLLLGGERRQRSPRILCERAFHCGDPLQRAERLELEEFGIGESLEVGAHVSIGGLDQRDALSEEMVAENIGRPSLPDAAADLPIAP
jgi:hypothetical protein